MNSLLVLKPEYQKFIFIPIHSNIYGSFSTAKKVVSKISHKKSRKLKLGYKTYFTKFFHEYSWPQISKTALTQTLNLKSAVKKSLKMTGSD